VRAWVLAAGVGSRQYAHRTASPTHDTPTPTPHPPTIHQVDHASLVEDLMSLTPESANVRAQMYLDIWRFPNTYTLGKNLTEKLIAQFHA